MRVKVEVKMDNTPLFTFSLFKAIVLHKVHNFLFYFLLKLPFTSIYLFVCKINDNFRFFKKN